MVSPGRNRNSVTRDTEDNSDLTSERVKEEEEWEGDDRRKHRSSRSKRTRNVEDSEGVESSGRKRSNGERNESRKRSAGSSRIGSDEDEFQAKKELRSQQMKKKQEESSLEKLSNWYEDGEAENKHDGISKSGKSGHSRVDENDRKKITSKLSDRESSQSRPKSKSERSDVELENAHDRDAKLEPKASSRDKGHVSSDRMRSQRRKWDESDTDRNTEDVNYVESSTARPGKSFDHKHENSEEKSLPGLTELSEAKGRDSESNAGKVTKTLDKDERRVDSEKGRSRSRSEVEEENNGISLVCEDISDKERLEQHRSQRDPTVVDVVASGEKSFDMDEDGNTLLMRGKTRRDTEWSNKSRSPERSGRRYHESEHSEMEHERNSNFGSKEIEKEGYWDDRFKGRDDSWSNRNRNREGSRDNWKRRQPNIIEKDLKDGDAVYDHGRDWELQRRGRDRVDNERPQGRFGGRKDGNRTEAVKTSSNYGNENYDVIEIQTKPFDYVREEPVFAPSRSNEAVQQSDTKLPPNVDNFAYPQDYRAEKVDSGPGHSVEDSKDIIMDDGLGSWDQDSWRGEIGLRSGNGRGEKGTKSDTAAKSISQSSSGGSQVRHVSEEVGSFNRTVPVGNRGNRSGRGRNLPTGRDNQHVSNPVPMVGSPFGPLGMPPPGALQPLTPNMSPGPPIPPGVFIPPFSPPVVWPGARGMDMNLLGVPPGMSPVPPGPSGPRFSPNMGTPPSPAMFYNQPGSGRGGSSNMSGVNFNTMLPAGRGQPQEKNTGGWVPPRSNVPHGKAPSRGEQNDYSQNFVDTGMRPQNYIRELELTSVVEDYPKLRELIQKKDEIVTNSATAPMYYKCDLREQVLSPEFFGTKFDVILVDPPWEEYVHRAPGVSDHMDYWTFEEIMNLKIEAIADTPSFIFLWVGDGLGLEQGRQCLKKWGFRRCEDICWVKTNKTTATPGLRHDSRTLFQRSKEHCLMGIKGTVRRSTDGHIIHANIDTDVIIAEEPPYGSTAKPEGMYRIVEHFCLGRRRLELFGEDHNIRSGWLTVGKDLSSSNFNSEAYIRNFADKDGKIWQGGGGRNPPPEAGHLVLTTPDIESLRPKSPMKNQMQMQQQHSNSITLTTPTSGNKRPGNSLQNYNTPIMNEEASGSNNLSQWPSQMEGFRGQEFGVMGSDDRVFDMYTYNAPFMQRNGDYSEYENRRAMNML